MIFQKFLHHFRGMRWLGIASLLVAQGAFGEDWPRWRGVRGDGTWQGPRLPETWPAGGPHAEWRVEIGGGYAGVVVSGQRLYTMDLVKGPPDRERILCIDVGNGKVLWSHAYAVEYGDLDYGNGPRAAPTVFEGRVYTLGAVGHARCLDSASGKVVWAKDLVKRFGAEIPTWGLAASPVIDGPRVILQGGATPGGCLITFDRVSGEEIWRSLSDPAGYATPILVDRPTGRQVVAWTPEHVCGVDARTGESLWKIPYKVNLGVSIATPIFAENIVFVSGYWEGSKAILLGEGAKDASLLWEENENLRGLMSQPLYRDGYVYSIDKRNGLTCFELKTGKVLWNAENAMTPKGRNPQATMVWLGQDDRVIVLNSEGELILARFNPGGYRESSRVKIIGPTWAHPAYAGTHVYARNDTELVCVSLTDGNR
jgi:outer membrane protein assembly factor BamB